jgi:hypothetical protein
VAFDLSQFLQVTVGVSSCGAIALLAFKLLRIVTRHNILLTGQCVDANELIPARADEVVITSYPRPFHYRLRIQSLEAIRTEYPLEVTIRGFPNGTPRSSPEHRVWVTAGWKPITIICALGGSDAPAGGYAQRDSTGSEPFLWKAQFQELPAFDAWSFDVVMPCERLEFSVAFAGVEETKLLAPTYGPYFEPDRLTVFASDRDQPRVRGSVTMPRPVVPLILSILAVGTYLLFRALSAWRIDWTVLALRDYCLMVAEVLLIWLGYSVIRRPVYPVISGYRFITPPWPSQENTGEGNVSRPG